MLVIFLPIVLLSSLTHVYTFRYLQAACAALSSTSVAKQLQSSPSGAVSVSDMQRVLTQYGHSWPFLSQLLQVALKQVCVCACVCLCVYMFVCVCVCAYVCVHVGVHVGLHVSVHECMHMSSST